MTERLLWTQLPPALEGIGSTGVIARQQRQFALQPQQLRMWRAACQRLGQRLPRPARVTCREQTARPGDVGEDVVRIQLEITRVALRGRVSETEQLQFARHLHITEAQALGRRQCKICTQGQGKVAALLVQVGERGTGALVARIQRDRPLVFGNGLRHLPEAVVGITSKRVHSTLLRREFTFDGGQRQPFPDLLGRSIEQTALRGQRS